MCSLPPAFFVSHFCLSEWGRKRRKPKVRISGQRARLSASVAAGPLLYCTSVTGRNLGAKKKPGGGRLIVSILDSQSSVGSAGKVGRCGCVFSHCLFCRSRMTPLRPDLSALAVRHLVCQSSPLSTAFASRIQDTGRLGGSFIFLLLGKLAALVFWAFVGRDVPIFAPIFGITGKICRQCKHISRVFVILLIGVPTAPLILDLSCHRHQRSSDLLDFRISVSQLSSFCLPSIRNQKLVSGIIASSENFSAVWFRSVNREGTGRDCALPGRRGSVRWSPSASVPCLHCSLT